MTKKAYGSLNPKISREICNNMKRRIHLIVGARPNFMKMAPLYKALKEQGDRYTPALIHTGQHIHPCGQEIVVQASHLLFPKEKTSL